MGTATGVISLAIEVSKTLKKIAEDMRDAPGDVKNFALQLKEVTAIIVLVQHILQKEQALFTPLLFEQVHSAFERFHSINQDVKSIIPVELMDRASWKSFLWAFKNRKRVKDCMESIEAIKSFMGPVLQLATLTATRNEQVQISEMAAPNNQDAKLSNLYSTVSIAVEDNRKLIHRQQNSNSGPQKSISKKDASTQHHLLIQPTSGPIEDAATWLYRLVFLPAAQASSSPPDGDKMANDTSTATDLETSPFLASHRHPDSDLTGGRSTGIISSSNAPSPSDAPTSSPPINKEEISTTCDTHNVINSLLRTWTSLDPIPPALVSSDSTDDFQAQVRKRIEEYNSQVVFRAREQGKKKKKNNKSRTESQAQGVPQAPRAASSVETLRRAGDVRDQDVQRHETESQGAPVDRDRGQPGRAMSVVSAAYTDRNFPRPQRVVIPPDDEQDISSVFSGFTGPSNIDRTFSYSQSRSETFAPRSSSPVSRISGLSGPHPDDLNTKSEDNVKSTSIAISTEDITLRIENANMMTQQALAEFANMVEASARNRLARIAKESSSDGHVNKPKGNDMNGRRRRLWERVGAVVSRERKKEKSATSNVE